jgi:retinol dehydrogenase-12
VVDSSQLTEMIAQPLGGKTIVITGATDGIGRVASERLCDMGANVVMIGRNAAKTEAAARAIMNATGKRNVTWEIADLADVDAVRDVAERLRARLPKIDVLIDNAGAIFAQRSVTRDGFERTFALNHLAYFALTLGVLDKLYAAGAPGDPARVIVVSSSAHRRAKLNFDDLQSARSFRPWRAYENTKLENLLFVRSLNARLDHSRVVVFALHPGVVSTRFATSGNGGWGRFMRWSMNLLSISPEEGADTMIWLASNAEVTKTSGDYFIKRVRHATSHAATIESDAEQLWAVTAQLCGIDADAIARRARG